MYKPIDRIVETIGWKILNLVNNSEVLSNIVLFLSIFHLAMADLLWITYTYVSLDKVKNNLPTN